ncbi:MAG: hypothetical protein KDC55_12795 [Ignavibacteriae bacterium]|nr:hypothetical protein [Ignavibacteriota bacterium]
MVIIYWELYTYEDNYIRALVNLKEAKKIGTNSSDSEKIKDKYGCTLYYIGDLYFQKKDYQIALDYYKRSYDIFNSFTETDLAREDLYFTLTSFAFTTIREDKAYTMYSIGRSYLELNTMDTARIYLNKSLTVAKKTTHNRLEARIYYALARLEHKNQNLDLSKNFSGKSLVLSKSSNLNEYVIYNYLLQMEIDLVNGDYNNIEGYYNKTIPLVMQMGMKSELAKAKQLYAVYSNQIGNSNLAFQMLEEANSIREELNDDEVARKFGQQESEMKYQQNVYDLELESMKAKEEEKRVTTQLYFSIAILFLILLMAILIYINSRKNKKLSEELGKINKQLESANTQLVELNDTKTKLFRIISHDLKNPIKEFDSGVKHLISNQTIDKDNLNKYLTNLSKSASNIQGLLYSLLNWAESQFSDRPIVKTEVDINDILQKVMPLYQQMIDEKEIKIRINLSVQTLDTDANILQIILRNIIHNSIKFTLNEGTISIKTDTEDDFTILQIADTGIGIRKDQVEAILTDKHFYHSQTDLFKSTGVGLRAVKDYIDQLGGNLFIESTPGNGTIVTIYFP